MVFYTIIMGITYLSVLLMLIRQDIRMIGGPLQSTVCLLKEI